MPVQEALTAPPFARRMDALGTENAFKIGPRIREVEQSGRRVIKCNLGEPDFALAPHIAAEVKRQIDLDQTHYVDPQGIEPLRIAIAKSSGEKRGLKISPDQVVVFPGAKPPIGFAQQIYCDPGDEVIYPSPGFPIYESFTRFVGAVPVPLRLREETEFTCRPRDLEPLITRRTKLLFLNFPSNPTGGVATREQLEEIAAVARYEAPAEMRIYSDEVYEDIIFDGARHHSIASLRGMAERTIIVSGVSKSYAWTGGRVGWAILPTSQEAAAFRNMNINYFSCVPAYNQHGARVALESPESAPVIAEMVDAFSRRRDLVVRSLNEIDGITCTTPRGAFYVWPNISGLCRSLGVLDAYAALPMETRKQTSPSTLFQLFLLYRYQVATLDRRSFGVIGSENEHYLRVSIATGTDDLEEAMNRFAAAAKDRAGFRRFMDEGRHS
ncbi:MAG TPA: aminotransferase class I/II-fold pyridoxal phosphate-dependent enzyme [Thermoanaerobaculia bacterium]